MTIDPALIKNRETIIVAISQTAAHLISDVSSIYWTKPGDRGVFYKQAEERVETIRILVNELHRAKSKP